MAGIAGAVRCKALPSRIHLSAACCAGEGRTRGFANTGKDLAGDPLKIPVGGGACAACARAARGRAAGPRNTASVPDAEFHPVRTYLGDDGYLPSRKALPLRHGLRRATSPSGRGHALPVGELSAQLTERAKDHLPLSKHPWRSLPQCTGAISNAGSPPTHRKPNTFVKPAELAHRASKAVRQL